MLAGVNFEVPVSEYLLVRSKSPWSGNGDASKEQVQYMIKSLLKLKTTPKFFDATDAPGRCRLPLASNHAPAIGFKSWRSFSNRIRKES